MVGQLITLSLPTKVEVELDCDKREKNAIYSGHLRLCQQPRAAHTLRSKQKQKTILLTKPTAKFCTANFQSGMDIIIGGANFTTNFHPVSSEPQTNQYLKTKTKLRKNNIGQAVKKDLKPKVNLPNHTSEMHKGAFTCKTCEKSLFYKDCFRHHIYEAQCSHGNNLMKTMLKNQEVKEETSRIISGEFW